MINKILVLIAIAGLTIACQTTPTIPENGSSITARLEQPFSLPIERVAEIPSEDLQVRFVAVEEDSRCPVEIQCAWAGEVNPYPKNPGKLDVEDYVATLQVSRK